MVDNTHTADDAHEERTGTARLEDNLKSRSTWMRFLYMLMFGVFIGVALSVLVVIVVFQFLTTLFAGNPNDKVLGLARGLTAYVSQILLFLTFNSEDKPFPFSDWPTSP